MHKKVILFLLFLALLGSVEASKEADWLVERSQQGVWSNMRETAYGILALDKENGYDSLVLNGSRSLINSLENCMLTNSCDVKDTAIAVLALHEIGGNANIVNKAGTWLINSRSIVFTGELPNSGNEWFVQIVSDVAGSCDLNNFGNGRSIIVPVDTSRGYVPWFSIDNNILTTTTESLNLDCSSLGSNSALSLINKKNIGGVENYFIKQEEHGKRNITVNFGNPCWGPNYRGGNCNTETSAYVLYTLDKIGKSGDPSWLTSQSNLGLKEKAFLLKITSNNQYLSELAAEKNALGFWGSADLPATVLIYSLLKPNPVVNGVETWVASRRHDDGCWPKPSCNVENTALVLYSGSYQPSQLGCPDLDGDGICDSNDNDIDGDGLLNNVDSFPRNPDANKDNILDGEEDLDRDGFANKEDNDIDGDGVPNEDDRAPFDETIGRPERVVGGGDSFNLGDICTTSEGCEGKRNAIGECIDIKGDGCPRSDTSSGRDAEEDVIRDSGTTTTPGAPKPAKSEEGSSIVLWSLLVLLLFIALVGGGFLAYKKGLLKFKFGGKKPQPELKYIPRLKAESHEKYTPRVASHLRREKPGITKEIERELDQSMKDLEKLLGKK